MRHVTQTQFNRLWHKFENIRRKLSKQAEWAQKLHNQQRHYIKIRMMRNETESASLSAKAKKLRTLERLIRRFRRRMGNIRVMPRKEIGADKLYIIRLTRLEINKLMRLAERRGYNKRGNKS